MKQKSLNHVLQVNVRLSEGGAAGVARNLATELEAGGIATTFAYGYGPHGTASPDEISMNAIRLAPRPIAAANRASHLLTGKETPLLAPGRRDSLKAALHRADVVHLHAIHSYFINPKVLFEMIIQAAKPVVWTMHDQWALTGRCALPGSCNGWATGCGKCPNLKAYPPALFDHAAKRWSERSALIKELQDAVPSAVVACAAWLGERAENAGLRNVAVIQNSVDQEYWEAAKALSGSEDRDNKFVFICRDLRDTAKVDWNLLRRISELPQVRLTIIGDNAPVILPGVEYMPSVRDRLKLPSVLGQSGRLIFTSKVDHFPLTIAEALTAGLHVVAADSPAAREFADFKEVQLCGSDQELVAACAEPKRADAAADGELAKFAPARMARDYVRIYESLVAAKI